MIRTIFPEIRPEFAPQPARLWSAPFVRGGFVFLTSNQILRRPVGRRWKVYPMPFDPTKHLSKLDRIDLTEDTKLELIHSLNDWANAFVGRSFQDLPVHVLAASASQADSAMATNPLHFPNTPNLKGGHDA